MKEATNKFAVLVLAAGSSKRMGKAKLLLKYKGRTLIENCIETVSQIAKKDIYIVTGAYQSQIEKALLPNQNLNFIHNPDHLDGMGSSIACGVSKIISNKHIGILLILPDQILVESKILQEILELSKLHPDSVIISSYGETSGPPTLFPAHVLPSLLELNGDKGAKSGILKNFDQVAYNFPFGIIDIDKMEDCKKFDIIDLG